MINTKYMAILIWGYLVSFFPWQDEILRNEPQYGMNCIYQRYLYNNHAAPRAKSNMMPSSSSSKKKEDNDNSKSKLSHQGFRLEDQVIKTLGEDAARKGVSVSGLVNKILKNYVTHEMQFEELGFILVSKDFLRRTFNVIDDEKHIEDFGKEFGTTMAKEYVSYFYPKVNGHTLVQFLDYWFRRFQACKHSVESSDRNQRHYFTVNHDINIKFSLAMKAILEGLIEPVTKTTVEFGELAENSVTFSFEV